MSHRSKSTKWIYRLACHVIGRIKDGPLKGSKWTVFSGIRYLKGTFEPIKVRALYDHLEPGGVMIDVGANVGYLTLAASKIVGPEGIIYAFEPSAINFAFLKKNVKVNGLKNVRLFQQAVGASSGNARLDTSTGRGTHHVSESGDQPIELVAIDELLDRNELRPPTLIKVDVEGYEMEVLAGMQRCIERLHPYIIIAAHYDLGPKVRSTLESYGYSVEEVKEYRGDIEMFCRPPASPDTAQSASD